MSALRLAVASDMSALGRAVELRLAIELLERGCKVAVPLVDDDGVDLIVDYRLTVQVKASGSRDSRGRFNISLGGPLAEHVDVLSVYGQDVGCWWHIPRPSLGLGRTLKLREDYRRGPSLHLDDWRVFRL